ncbi:transporter substrate-binding domain-containing protein [Pseudoduganella sp. FT26W]|uniref:Transporter substrate-binding domain-containing protein n=1 Tax=Duganella aquatilis TaxID=2666082 RepID=A0A844CRQ1_9BURK|nr:transporter substrate-binding domain-containing protein [Duganella aquatilis]MRW82608.1 transporter substrate-binding domain-containing protein [Duganella aquatilis]
MMRRNRMYLIATLWCSLPAAHAAAACPPVTRVGLSDLGYTSYRDQGRIAGIAVDVANEMGRRTGCKFEFHWYPRQRLFVELAAGRIDMTMGALRTPERDAYARYLPYAWLQYDLVLAQSGGRQYASLSDFVAHGSGRLNVTRGAAYDTAIETQLALLASAGRLEVVNDFETVFGKLEMGRADGTLATPPIYGKYLKHSRLKARTVIVPLPEATPQFTGIYLSKQTISPAVRQRYAAALKAMTEEQKVRAIYTHYFDEATVKRTFRLGPAPLLGALSAED